MFKIKKRFLNTGKSWKTFTDFLSISISVALMMSMVPNIGTFADESKKNFIDVANVNHWGRSSLRAYLNNLTKSGDSWSAQTLPIDSTSECTNGAKYPSHFNNGEFDLVKAIKYTNQAADLSAYSTTDKFWLPHIYENSEGTKRLSLGKEYDTDDNSKIIPESYWNYVSQLGFWTRSWPANDVDDAERTSKAYQINRTSDESNDRVTSVSVGNSGSIAAAFNIKLDDINFASVASAKDIVGSNKNGIKITFSNDKYSDYGMYLKTKNSNSDFKLVKGETGKAVDLVSNGAELDINYDNGKGGQYIVVALFNVSEYNAADTSEKNVYIAAHRIDADGKGVAGINVTDWGLTDLTGANMKIWMEDCSDTDGLAKATEVQEVVHGEHDNTSTDIKKYDRRAFATIDDLKTSWGTVTEAGEAGTDATDQKIYFGTYEKETESESSEKAPIQFWIAGRETDNDGDEIMTLYQAQEIPEEKQKFNISATNPYTGGYNFTLTLKDNQSGSEYPNTDVTGSSSVFNNSTTKIFWQYRESSKEAWKDGKPDNPGKYLIRCYVEYQPNCYGETYSNVVTFTKLQELTAADFVYTGPEQESDSKVTYNNGDPKTATVTLNGKTENIEVKYYKIEGEGETELAAAPTENGKYVVKVNYTAPEGSLYASKNGITDAEWTFDIKDKLTPTLTLEDNQSVTYDSQKAAAYPEEKVTYQYDGADVTDNSIKYQYKIGENDDWNDNMPTNAGTYTIRAISPGTYKYNEVTSNEVTFTINKETPKYTKPESIDINKPIYYGNKLENVCTSDGLKDLLGLPTDSNDHDISGTWSWVDGSETSVGNVGNQTFTAKFTPDDTTNYNWADTQITGEGAKVENNEIKVDINVNVEAFEVIYDNEPTNVAITPSPEELTYTGKAQEPNLTIKLNDGSNTELTKGTDYEIVCTDKISAGEKPYTINFKGNYKGSATKELKYTIKPAELTVTVIAHEKVYDGTKSATVDIEFDGKQNNETFTEGENNDYTFTAEFNDADVDNNKDVNVTITWKNANYTLDKYNDTKQANITPKPINVKSITVDPKTFDGKTDATITRVDFEDDDQVAVDGLTKDTDYTVTGNFDDANVGTNKTVTPAINWINANYKLNNYSEKKGEGTISAKPITVGSITVAEKTYDGEKTATISEVNFMPGDEVESCKLEINTDYDVVTAEFKDANVGKDKKVDVKLSMNGTTKAKNYSVTNIDSLPEGEGDITEKPVNVDNIIADDKTYNGNADATISTITFNGLVSTETKQDSLTVADCDITAKFVDGDGEDDKNAGKNKKVEIKSISFKPSSETAKNYKIGNKDSLPPTTANINKRVLKVTDATADNKTYDGKLDATLKSISFDDLVSGEKLEPADCDITAEFNDANVGDGKTVTVKAVTLKSGSVADNYKIDKSDNGLPRTATANITQATPRYTKEASAENGTTINFKPELKVKDIYDSEGLKKLLGSPKDSEGKDISGTWNWVSGEELVGNAENNKKTFKANFTADEDIKGNYDWSNITIAYGDGATQEGIGKVTDGFTVDVKVKVDAFEVKYKGEDRNVNITTDETKFIYNGKVQKPTIKIELIGSNTVLENGKDYTIGWSDENSTNVGPQTYSITFKDNYSGFTGKYSYTIEKATPKYTKPDPIVINKTIYYGNTLDDVCTSDELKELLGSPKGSENKDISGTWSWVDGPETSVGDAGSQTLTAKFTPDEDIKGNYDWNNLDYGDKATQGGITPENDGFTVDVNVTVKPLPIGEDSDSPASVELTPESELIYNGLDQMPTVTVKESGADDAKILEEGKDFTIECPDKKSAGEDKPVTIKFTGNYEGEINKSYSIEPAELTPEVEASNKTYDGELDAPVKVDFTGLQNTEQLTEGTDYTVIASFDDADVGTAKAVTVSIALNDTTKAKNYTLSKDLLGTVADINRKSITVTADDSFKVRGEDDPTLTYTIDSATSLIEGETLVGTLSRVAGETPESYDIMQGTLTDENNPNYKITFNKGTFKILDWGTTEEHEGITQYVDEKGMTSVKISPENTDENGKIWLKEESDGSSAWYGIDNSEGVFQEGSRFHVQWLNEKENPDAFKNIDEKIREEIDNNNGWLFEVGVTAPDGTEYKQLGQPIDFYVQIGDDWDKEDLEAFYIQQGEDESVPVRYDIENYPEGSYEFGILTLSHFSPYFVYDKLSDEEKAALEEEAMSGERTDEEITNEEMANEETTEDEEAFIGESAKTGENIELLAIAGFGLILSIALGLILITKANRKKFNR